MNDQPQPSENSVEATKTQDAVSNVAGAKLFSTHIGATVGGAIGIAGGLAASAASGAATGTLLGGPAGAAVGLVVGAVLGGLIGKATAESIDPDQEEAFWRLHYRDEPYYQEGTDYAHYSAAYRTGYEGRARYNSQSFEDAEPYLQSDYNNLKGDSTMTWEHGIHAARSAWDRLGSPSHPKI